MRLSANLNLAKVKLCWPYPNIFPQWGKGQKEGGYCILISDSIWLERVNCLILLNSQSSFIQWGPSANNFGTTGCPAGNVLFIGRFGERALQMEIVYYLKNWVFSFVVLGDRGVTSWRIITAKFGKSGLRPSKHVRKELNTDQKWNKSASHKVVWRVNCCCLKSFVVLWPLIIIIPHWRWNMVNSPVSCLYPSQTQPWVCCLFFPSVLLVKYSLSSKQ